MPNIHRTAQEDVVRQFPDRQPLQQLLERPVCSKCGTKMWLARIEPHDRPDHDVRTFECSECDHSEIMTVKFR
jgi:hypothetical protein